MACHYSEPGHTKIILGAVYSQWRRHGWSSCPYRLKKINWTTEMAFLVGGSRSMYLSLSDLSHWYLSEQEAWI